MKRLLVVLAVVAFSFASYADLINGSFETTASTTNALYWDGQSGGSVLASSTWGNGDVQNWNSPPDGANAYYLKGTWNGEPNFGGVWQRVDGGIQNAEYTLTGYFYTDNGFAAATSDFKLEFYDASDVFLGSTVTNVMSGLPSATWTPVSIVATSPANTAHIMVVFEVSGANASGVLGGDDFTFTTTIPEPSTIAMIGLAGLLIAIRRFIQG